MNDKEYEEARRADTLKILSSSHKRRVVLAGPGTGKSFLLAEAIKVKREQGKNKFHAITFIGKLGDSLADDLAGLSRVTTLHSFAREFVLKRRPKGWVYLPYIKRVILADLETKGINTVVVGDKNYENRSNYYKAIGDDDVVFYAAKLLKEYGDSYPDIDMLLVDEFQDFNEVEDEFISLLADKIDVLIVGDDDQALYKWKNAHPKFIRGKHAPENKDYESHTLRWCTRCPEVVIGAFQDLVEANKEHLEGRSVKEYICYLPEKKADSENNPKLILLRAQYTSIAQSIHRELERIIATQKIKSVLVIGEARSCSKTMLPSIAKVLRESGFKNVDFKEQDKPLTLHKNIFDGYKSLTRDNNLQIGWRLIAESLPEAIMKDLIQKSFDDSEGILKYLDNEFISLHSFNANTFSKLIKGPASTRNGIAESSIDKLKKQIIKDKKTDRMLLTEQLIDDSNFLRAPLANLDITVCSITGSKGLGADVVFVVGFDQGKFPVNETPKDDEIYHMLVALTRTKKRFYMINTLGIPVSSFISTIQADRYESR